MVCRRGICLSLLPVHLRQPSKVTWLGIMNSNTGPRSIHLYSVGNFRRNIERKGGEGLGDLYLISSDGSPGNSGCHAIVAVLGLPFDKTAPGANM